MKIARLTCLVVFSFAPFAQQNSQVPLEARAQKHLAVLSGQLKAQGLQQPVEVLRDRWGVAHINAQNQHDLFFAQGFVAAQDRLFQMELWKRAGEGRLAEILGPSALARDVNARLLRYRGDMKAEYESYSPDTQEILQAFTSGINAYVASLDRPGGPGLPLELKLAGFRPTPWTPEDCLNRMAAFAMTNNSFAELFHAQLIKLIGKEKATKLLDLDPAVELDPAPSIDFAGLSPELLKDVVGSDARIERTGRRVVHRERTQIRLALHPAVRECRGAACRIHRLARRDPLRVGDVNVHRHRAQTRPPTCHFRCHVVRRA